MTSVSPHVYFAWTNVSNHLMSGLSASPFCIDIITFCPTHPSFTHWRSSSSGRCFPTVEHSVAERHVGAVSICFRKHLKIHLLNRSFSRIACSAHAREIDVSDTNRPVYLLAYADWFGGINFIWSALGSGVVLRLTAQQSRSVQ